MSKGYFYSGYLNNDNIFNSYDICSYHNTRPSTNLSKISLTTSMNKKMEDEYPKSYKIDLYYLDQKMKKKKSLGSGTFGEVYLYEIKIENSIKSVVVKKPLKGADPYEEPDILKNYMGDTKNCNHYSVPIRSIEDQNGNPFIIMQEANGMVNQIILDDRLKIKLIKFLTKSLECYYKKGLLYTDLKTENILYKCRDEKIEFYLGDIGSFVPEYNSKNKNYATATFIPPEYAEKSVKATRETLLYVMGATFADIYGLADDLVFETSSGKIKSKKMFKDIYIPLFIEKIKNSNIPENIKDIILALTSFSPKERSNYSFDYIYKKLK